MGWCFSYQPRQIWKPVVGKTNSISNHAVTTGRRAVVLATDLDESHRPLPCRSLKIGGEIRRCAHGHRLCGNIDFADGSTYAVVQTTVVIAMLGRTECHNSIHYRPPCVANFGQPELYTLAPVPPLWPPSPSIPTRFLVRSDWRCPLSSPPEPVGFRAEFQPATVAVAASDYSYTFKVVRATDPSHRPVLGRRWSPEPARASTAAGEPPFGLDSTHLWPRLRLSSPPPWLPSCHGLGAPELLLRFAGVEARPSQSLDPVTARSWSDPLADPFNQPG